jgi:DivIVA domain-containing protein
MIGRVSDAGPDPATDPGEPTFPRKPFLRTGYDRACVDEFVAKVVLAIHDEQQTTVSADDVAQQRFPSRRFGSGYGMREVDDYLGVAEALLRMRATAHGAGPRPGSSPTTPRRHHATWWIYGIAAVLVVAIVVLTLTQT